jgi:hypothetical protein
MRLPIWVWKFSAAGKARSRAGRPPTPPRLEYFYWKEKDFLLLDKRASMKVKINQEVPMKKHLSLIVLALLAGPLCAANAGPKENVINAAKKLAAQKNYSWEMTITNLSNNRFHFGPNEGKTEKDGYTWYSMKMNDNTTEILMKGTNAAVKTPDAGWQTRAEATEGSDEPGPAMFLALLLDNFKTPAQDAEDLASKAREIEKTNGVYSSVLTEDGANTLLAWRRPNGSGGPTVSNAKGSVKFWVKHGLLTKYEYNLQGTLDFNGNDFNVNRTTTVQIKGVGSTKITVPDEARKNL